LLKLQNQIDEATRSTSSDSSSLQLVKEEGRMAAIALLNHRKHNADVLSVCWIASPKNRAADRQQMFGPMKMISDDVAGKKSDQR
jgi:hypothetical protein